MKELKATAYICGTDMQYEMQASDMAGDCKVSPNVEYAKRTWACAEECGIAEVEVRFVRWAVEPKARAVEK